MVAVMLASGVAVAKAHINRQSAPNYYNTGTSTSPVWNSLTKSEGTDPGTYRCTAADNYCTAHFDSAPIAGQIPTDFENGLYVKNGLHRKWPPGQSTGVH